MRILIDSLEVLFPYESIYAEQESYMRELKKILDEGGAPGEGGGRGGAHGLLEMPTGTGKTVALLSLILAYRDANKDQGQLIYCTRTVPEMTQVIEELKTVIAYRARETSSKTSHTLGVCLSSRRNMCVNEEVMADNDLEEVDTKCRMKTASWVRSNANGRQDGLCEYYERLESSEVSLPGGIYGLEDLKRIGREKKLCPYFLTRNVLQNADVIVYNYQYMLDPKVSSMVSSQLDYNSIVVFDEAHNIDNVCIEAFSIALNRRVLSAATGNMSKLRRKVQHLRETDKKRLEEEYLRLVSGLDASTQKVIPSRGERKVPAGQQRRFPPPIVEATSAATKDTDTAPSTIVADLDEYVATPVLPDDVLSEALPGNIRRAEHFLGFLLGVLEFLKAKIDVKDSTMVKKNIPSTFRADMLDALGIQERKPLRFCYSRLGRLLRTLQITDVGEYTPLSLVADFATVLATYDEGFVVLLEPSQSHAPNLIDPLLQLACTDSSLAMKPVFKKFRSVIITSGTLSPISLYPNLLDFRPKVSQSFQMSMPKNRTSIMCPLVVTRGADQSELTTAFEKRDNPSVVRNYGDLLIELVRSVPDGIVCFFTSYQYMEDTVARWKDMGVLDRVLEHKLIFIETKDIVETTLALDNYRRSCDCGRGAVFLSVARGKVAEGVNFEHHYGRCVVMFGIPYQYTKSRVLLSRLEFLENKFQVQRKDFLAFDAMRQVAQCMGRVIRSKTDYGVMIFADSRYRKHDKWSKLPQWIQRELKKRKEHRSLSTPVAIDISRRFLRAMAQEPDAITSASGSLAPSASPSPATADPREITDGAGSSEAAGRGEKKRKRGA